MAAERKSAALSGNCKIDCRAHKPLMRKRRNLQNSPSHALQAYVQKRFAATLQYSWARLGANCIGSADSIKCISSGDWRKPDGPRRSVLRRAEWLAES